MENATLKVTSIAYYIIPQLQTFKNGGFLNT
jgi:hypothetical protein